MTGKNRGRPKGTGRNGQIKYLSDKQLEAFMKEAKQSKRDDFLFSLMLYVGARVAEIANLRLEDFNEESNQVVIRGVKSGNARVYTMPGKIWKKYQRWMKERANVKDSEKNSFMFITSHCTYDAGISRDGIQYLFKEYEKKAENVVFLNI